MPNRSCPHCARRLPYAGRRCVHCGWTVRAAELGAGAGIAPWRRAWVWALAVVMVTAFAGNVAFRNATAIADWYATFAARYLPDMASSFGPAASGEGAFFYCARQVSKEMEGDYSVETFPSARDSRTVELGEGRYRVVAFVDQATERGEQLRHDFTCTVRYERGRWVLERLDLERYAGADGPAVRVARAAR